MRTRSIPGCTRAAFVFGIALALAPVAKAQTHKYAYVTNDFFANSISVIDTDPSSATFDTAVATITTTGEPFGIALSPDNTRAYVTDFLPGNGPTNTIEVVDINPSDTLTYNTVVATITLPSGASPNLLTFTPDGSRAYVADNGTNQVSVIDTNPSDTSTYNTDIADITVGAGPTGIAITPDGHRSYVTNATGNSISVIDTNAADGANYNTVLATITTAVGLSPTGIGITPDGTRAYFTDFGNDAVQTLDINPADTTTYNTVVATITVSGFGPWGVAITPDGARAYVADSVNATVTVLDINPSDGVKYNTVSQTILGFGSTPEGLAITGDGLHGYVGDSFGNTTYAIDTNPSSLTYNTIVAGVTVGAGPQDIAVTPVQAPKTFPFAAFSAKLSISSSGFALNGSFTLGAGSPGIDLSTQNLTLTLDGFSMTIPAKSFQTVSVHQFMVFSGTVNATYQGNTVPISVSARIVSVGGGAYTVQISASGINLTGLATPISIGLTIGPNTGEDSPTNGHTGGNNSWH